MDSIHEILVSNYLLLLNIIQGLYLDLIKYLFKKQ